MIKKLAISFKTGNAENGKDIIKIPISAIRPLSSRQSEAAKRFQATMKAMEKNGVLAPVCVISTGNGKYELLAGQGRISMAVKAGVREIAAVVCYPNNEDEALIKLMRVTEGVFDCFQEADFFKRMIESGRYTQRTLAEKIGKSQSYVCNKLRLGRISIPLRKKIIEGGLSERHARQLLRLGDEKMRRIVTECAIKENLSVERTEERVNELLELQYSSCSRGYMRIVEKFKNQLEFLKEFNPDSYREDNAERLRLLIKTVAELVEITNNNGLEVSAGQRNSDKDIEIVIKVPKARNNVFLRGRPKIKPQETADENREAA